MKNFLQTLCAIATLCTIFSCTSNKDSDKNTAKISDTTNSASTVIETPIAKAPIINIQDSMEIKLNVLCIKDSASTVEGLYLKLSKIYNIKLQEVIKTNKLNVMGSPMAWQTIEKNAYFFEAGIPVDKTPAKMGKGMYMKNTGDDSTVLAHFWGPQNLTKSAYDALSEKISDMKRNKTSSTYEIYKGNYFDTTNAVVDFYKLQTDIVMPFKGIIPPKVKEVKLTVKGDFNDGKTGKVGKTKKKKVTTK